MVLDALGDLRNLLESETQELYSQFSKYKKYKKQLEELEEWSLGETTTFISEVEKIIKKNRLDVDSEYRLAVYVGRYPSYFYSIKNLQDNNQEGILKNRLKVLTQIEEQVLNYLSVLEELQ